MSARRIATFATPLNFGSLRPGMTLMNGTVYTQQRHDQRVSLAETGIVLDLDGSQMPSTYRRLLNQLRAQPAFESRTTKEKLIEIRDKNLPKSSLLDLPFFSQYGLSPITELLQVRKAGHHNQFTLLDSGVFEIEFHSDGHRSISRILDSDSYDTPSGYFIYEPTTHFPWFEQHRYGEFTEAREGVLAGIPFFLIETIANADKSDSPSEHAAILDEWIEAERKLAYTGCYCLNLLKQKVLKNLLVPYDVRESLKMVIFSAIMDGHRLDLYMHWCPVDEARVFMSFVDTFSFEIGSSQVGEPFMANEAHIARCGRVIRNIMKMADEFRAKVAEYS